MPLQSLLNQNLTQLTPKAFIIYKYNVQYSAQSVDYAPEILNLGAVLLAYYTNAKRIVKLRHLGNCLSVAHYLRSPRALKYGRDFTNNQQFKSLPAKLQKHLTGELNDCTMALNRDFGIKQPSVNFGDLNKFLASNSTPYVYLYQDNKWWLLKVAGHKEEKPVALRDKIRQLLDKKA